MPNDLLLTQIAQWHTAMDHGKIQNAILALPESERSHELTCLLARTLLNEKDYDRALAALDSIQERYSENPYYCVRRGLALFLLRREHEALPWFERARDLGLEEIDEMPGTYFPKSVAKWVERAQRRGPQRTLKNVFEASRRANRNKTPLEIDFTDAELEGLWADSPYALENYVGRVPTDKDFASTEAALGYRLPSSYKALMKRQNGGILARNSFVNPMQSSFMQENFSVESIYGVDCEKRDSLCGAMGSKFWIGEWGYPDVGVAICDTVTGGHDMIFLDYSDCGPGGEPCVVHIDQESDYEFTYLADDFAAFVRGLVPDEEEPDEEE